jgi:hypothetical protein
VLHLATGGVPVAGIGKPFPLARKNPGLLFLRFEGVDRSGMKRKGETTFPVVPPRVNASAGKPERLSRWHQLP